jgi:hypothetical protein
MPRSSADLCALVQQLAESVSELKASLQHPLLADLEQVLIRSQAALEAVNTWPGGTEALQTALEALPEPLRSALRGQIEQARRDHALNAELLSLAMQRTAALQAEAVRTTEAATYASDGGYKMGDSGRLLGKF